MDSRLYFPLDGRTHVLCVFREWDLIPGPWCDRHVLYPSHHRKVLSGAFKSLHKLSDELQGDYRYKRSNMLHDRSFRAIQNVSGAFWGLLGSEVKFERDRDRRRSKTFQFNSFSRDFTGVLGGFFTDS